jgi:hypothetical protein
VASLTRKKRLSQGSPCGVAIILEVSALAPARTDPVSASNRNDPREIAGSASRPNNSKQNQINPSKKAWIYLVLFVRIGTFQWVTAIPNKKSDRVSGSVPIVSSAFHLSVLPAAAPRARRTGSIRPIGKCIARISDFCKEIALKRQAELRVRLEARPAPHDAAPRSQREANPNISKRNPKKNERKPNVNGRKIQRLLFPQSGLFSGLHCLTTKKSSSGALAVDNNQRDLVIGFAMSRWRGHLRADAHPPIDRVLHDRRCYADSDFRKGIVGWRLLQ